MTEFHDWDEAGLAERLPGDLTAERMRLGLTQRDVAELMGVMPGLVSQIESGDPDVSEVTVLSRRARTLSARSKPMAA